MQRLTTILALLGLFLASGERVLYAAAPFLAADLVTEADPTAGGIPEPVAVFDGALYFWNSDPSTGRELWRSDGTPEGTALVADVCPGRCSSWTALAVPVVSGDALFFRACDGARGCQLWKTDGTAAGTGLVEAFGASDGSFRSTWVDHLTDWNGNLYFGAYDPVAGFELFRSDGTRDGTALVKDLRPGPEDSGFVRLVPAGERLFVSTVRELWVSDGSEAGTEKILTLEGDRYSGFLQEALGDLLVFTVRSLVLENELWASDGTPEGTFLLRRAEAWISELVRVGDEVFFFEVSDLGVELWKSDGTAAGTSRVRGGFGTFVEPVAAFGGELYFAMLSELWRSDGTAAGTVRVRAFERSIQELVAGDDALYMVLWSVGDNELWKTAGTSSERLLDTSAGRLRKAFAFGDRLALAVERPEEGEELALFDPSTGALEDLTETVDPGSGDPEELVDGGSRLLFRSGAALYAAGPDAGDVGVELLAEDLPDAELVGTEFGTFVFDRGLSILNAAGGPVELLAESSRRVLRADLSVELGGELYFLVLDPFEDLYELWVSDGTPLGTGRVAGGLPPNHFCFDPPCLPVSVGIAVAGGRILAAHQEAVWRADLGTSTFDRVFDTGDLAGCAEGFCQVGNLIEVGDRVFFVSEGDAEPTVLWVSDGTVSGTREVRELGDFPPFAGYMPPGALPPVRELTAVGETLYFVMGNPELGDELWTSDGTEAGTRVVRDVRPGPYSSFPSGLTAFKGRLAFAADDGESGHEPWVSDGTEAGTFRVADIYRGPGSSLPRDFAAAAGGLVFAADDGVSGAEPWRSDLTAKGTRKIADLAPGPAPSSPRDFTESGRWLFWNAGTSETGFELYALPGNALRGSPDRLRDALERARNPPLP